MSAAALSETDAASVCRVATALARVPVATSVRCTLVGSAARLTAQRQAKSAPLRCLLHGPMCNWLMPCKHIMQYTVMAVCCPDGMTDLAAAPRASHADPQHVQTNLVAPRAVASGTACCTLACIHHFPNASSQGGLLHAPQAAVPAVLLALLHLHRWLWSQTIAMPLLCACTVTLFCKQEASPLQVRFMCSEDAKESITAIMVSSVQIDACAEPWDGLGSA